MSSFSRRRIVAATIHRVSEPAHEASQSAEPEADGTTRSADQSVRHAGDHPAREEVDFDIAIAEVLMTLASGSGAADDEAPGADRDDFASLAKIEGEEAADLGEEGMIGSDDETDEETDDEEEAPDPEALLAAEAATFRLLGELDRLWHRAA
jgi:hypothetical protein